MGGGGPWYIDPGAFEPQGSRTLATVGLAVATVAGCLGFVGLVPCLGWLNWFALPGAGLAHILSWAAVLLEGRDPTARNRAVIGLAVSFVTGMVGVLRLLLGGGLF